MTHETTPAQRFDRHRRIEAAVDELDQALRDVEVLDWDGTLAECQPVIVGWQRRVVERLVAAGVLELPRDGR